ncbi:MAG TPA: HupE/UreJ family protein [Gemmatimonadaceae bacterium]|nr:HupE/UreJ family protein [Gemmatimonadaceae bacterium]
MSDFVAFVRLGFGHIVSLDAMDHLLFLVALAVVYRVGEWRSLLWAISAFTVGHSITLALAVTNVVRFPTEWIEFLIPVTIVATAVANIISLRDARVSSPRVILVGLFGLIHGAGFATYLRELFLESIAIPLAGFNVGIEIGQIAVVAVCWSLMLAVDGAARKKLRDRWTPYQARVLVVSSVVAVVSTAWLAARVP